MLEGWFKLSSPRSKVRLSRLLIKTTRCSRRRWRSPVQRHIKIVVESRIQTRIRTPGQIPALVPNLGPAPNPHVSHVPIPSAIPVPIPCVSRSPRPEREPKSFGDGTSLPVAPESACSLIYFVL